ncbi:cartilage intermediate layer protein 2 [Arapaima gigas]
MTAWVTLLAACALWLVCPDPASAVVAPRVCWTEWFDIDDPTETGDYETTTKIRATYPGHLCPRPRGMEAVTISGIPAKRTGDKFEKFGPSVGLVCLNIQQKSGDANLMLLWSLWMCCCVWADLSLYQLN